MADKAAKAKQQAISRLEQLHAAKRKLKCENCDATKVMTIFSKARDANLVTFPTGLRYDGYLPMIPKVCHGDGVQFDLCVNCGHIIGFDRERVVKAIENIMKEEEEDEDEDENDEEDSD